MAWYIVAAMDFIRSPLAKVIGFVAMIVAAFAAGVIYQSALSSAERNESIAKDAKAEATHSVAVAGLAQQSNRINTGVSNYVQNRTADLSARLGGLRQPTSDYRPMPGMAGSPSGAAACRPGCVPVEQFNDLAWEAGNSAVMVEGWQLWYRDQKTAWEAFLKKQSEGWEE